MASPKYTVDVIEDQPPTVTFEKPKRDTSANPVEEVFVQARADDDFGVKQLDLIYSVNGGAEKTVSLYGKGAKPLPQVSAGHTVYLEELGVKPGDFVSYYAKAYDTDTVAGPKSTSSDIYFVKIRAVQPELPPGAVAGRRRRWRRRASESGGRALGAAAADHLRDVQRRARSREDRRRQVQGEHRLHQPVAVQAARAGRASSSSRCSSGWATTTNFRKIAELLPKAAEEMKNAEDLLRGLKTKDALAPEQRALKHLQDAEQLYDMIVRQGGGGGGGGGGGQMASELADLFQLAARSPGESVRDGAARAAAGREPADRRSRRAAPRAGASSARAGRAAAPARAAQRQQRERRRVVAAALADEVGAGRAAARAAAAAARAAGPAAAGSRGRGAPAAGRGEPDAAGRGQQPGRRRAGEQALQQLQEAQRLLQQSGTQRVSDAVKEAQRKAEDLARQQKDVAQQVAGLDGRRARRKIRRCRSSSKRRAT